MKNTTAALTEAIYYCTVLLWLRFFSSTMSNGRLILSAGTLYGAISNLLEKGWILPCGESSDTDGRRKMYQITEKGQEVLLAELERLEELVENGRKNIKE